MLDRAPTKPNRYAVYDDEHNFIRYEYHERADEPTQEGMPICKETLLSDGTCAALGVPATSVPDDALAKLAVGAGKYGYFLTVKFSDGTPASGIAVAGVTKADGSACVTNNDGTVLAVSSSVSPTISISEYLDLAPYSATLTSTKVITPCTITLIDASDTGTISTSKTVKFARNVLVDLHLIGGGNNGSTPVRADVSEVYGGNSGKAYYITNKLANKNTAYSAIVGASGGSSSTLLGESSSSGTSSRGGTSDSVDGTGGGASPISGNLIFGGSGGAGGAYNYQIGQVIYTGNGSNGGGRGGTANSSGASNGLPGTQPGAGGGGGSWSITRNGDTVFSNGGAGAAGAIYYKWRLAQ